MFKQIIACLLFICIGAGLMPAADPAHDIKTFEGTLATGIMAIGGETTGTELTMKDGSKIELDLGKDVKLGALADSLNGKAVVVTGEFKTVQGVEIKERKVLVVETLKAAK